MALEYPADEINSVFDSGNRYTNSALDVQQMFDRHKRDGLDQLMLKLQTSADEGIDTCTVPERQELGGSNEFIERNLRKFSAVYAVMSPYNVLRDGGEWQRVKFGDIVAGDIVALFAGDTVPGDAFLIPFPTGETTSFDPPPTRTTGSRRNFASNNHHNNHNNVGLRVKVGEAMLTGESEPCSKTLNTDVCFFGGADIDTVEGADFCLVLIVAVGKLSFLGKIANFIEVPSERVPPSVLKIIAGLEERHRCVVVSPDSIHHMLRPSSHHNNANKEKRATTLLPNCLIVDLKFLTTVTVNDAARKNDDDDDDDDDAEKKKKKIAKKSEDAAGDHFDDGDDGGDASRTNTTTATQPANTLVINDKAVSAVVRWMAAGNELILTADASFGRGIVRHPSFRQIVTTLFGDAAEHHNDDDDDDVSQNDDDMMRRSDLATGSQLRDVYGQLGRDTEQQQQFIAAKNVVVWMTAQERFALVDLFQGAKRCNKKQANKQQQQQQQQSSDDAKTTATEEDKKPKSDKIGWKRNKKNNNSEGGLGDDDDNSAVYCFALLGDGASDPPALKAASLGFTHQVVSTQVAQRCGSVLMLAREDDATDGEQFVSGSVDLLLDLKRNSKSSSRKRGDASEDCVIC